MRSTARRAPTFVFATRRPFKAKDRPTRISCTSQHDDHDGPSLFELGPLVANTFPSLGAYTPTQVEQAYGFNEISLNGVAGNGSGETIAIVDAYNDANIQSDLNTFDTQFGLPATTVQQVNQTGGTSYPASDSTGSWELEESLDVESACDASGNNYACQGESDSNSDPMPPSTTRRRGTWYR